MVAPAASHQRTSTRSRLRVASRPSRDKTFLRGRSWTRQRPSPRAQTNPGPRPIRYSRLHFPNVSVASSPPPVISGRCWARRSAQRPRSCHCGRTGGGEDAGLLWVRSPTLRRLARFPTQILRRRRSWPVPTDELSGGFVSAWTRGSMTNPSATQASRAKSRAQRELATGDHLRQLLAQWIRETVPVGLVRHHDPAATATSVSFRCTIWSRSCSSPGRYEEHCPVPWLPPQTAVPDRDRRWFADVHGLERRSSARRPACRPAPGEQSLSPSFAVAVRRPGTRATPRRGRYWLDGGAASAPRSASPSNLPA